MHRILLAAGLAVSLSAPVAAQTWAPWYQPSLLDQPSQRRAAPPPSAAPRAKPKQAAVARPAPLAAPVSLTPSGPAATASDPDSDEPLPPAAPAAPVVLDGGPRPSIDPQAPSRVTYSSSQPAGTIVIDTAARRLLLVQSSSTALSYPVSVGREGFTWSGTEKISRVADWPDWHPPAEMRERDPKLPTKMTGGVRNPLGAKALYLGNSLYRIHGTSDARSVGRAASSGCFRMHNRHVVDLARRVGVGTRVVVINAPGAKTASAAEAPRSRTRPSP